LAIPESQLETWSHQGSIAQSSDTYNAIKRTLETASTPYAGKDYTVFLQGSYGNNTNIYAESDVDIVIRLDSTFYHDLTNLDAQERSVCERTFNGATYNYVDFKRDVERVLIGQYGSDVTVGDKAIFIASNGVRRDADVIVCTQFRRYHRFKSILDQHYDEGICFWDRAGTQIINYPKQHSVNMTTKHRDTANWFKPMVRVIKNVGRHMVDNGRLQAGVAPSYYLEGLLYNVPNNLWGGSYRNCFANAITWIQQADKSKFLCANEQYYLLYEGSPVTWRAEKCEKFLAGAIKLWQDW
jgi:hypothetical protein